MDGAEYQMAGHGCSHGDFCCLPISDFAHGDDVRVLPQYHPQGAGKGQSGFFAYLYLTDPIDMVLHRILQREPPDR